MGTTMAFSTEGAMARKCLTWSSFAEAHDALDACAVVPASIEDDDLACGRQVADVALQVHLGLFAFGRRRQRNHAKHPRIDPFGDGIDRVESGIILLEYWLEVSSEEQTRRLEARINDGRKIWKLSPMDLKSYSRWFDYSRARDEMFEATDSSWAPWFVVRSDDKKRARLDLITHLLERIPYQSVPREKVKLPKRQKQRDYRESNYTFKLIPEVY